MDLNTYNELKQAIGRHDHEGLKSLLEGISKEDASSYVSKNYYVNQQECLLEVAIVDNNIDAIKAMAPYHDKEKFCNPVRRAFQSGVLVFTCKDEGERNELIRELIPLSNWERETVGCYVLWRVSDKLDLVREIAPLVKDKSWALYAASHAGNLDIVRELLTHIEHPIEHFDSPKYRGRHDDELFNAYDNFEWHPLDAAASKGHVEIVRELIPHSDPKAEGSRALWCGAKNGGNIEVVKELLPHSDISNWEDWNEVRPEMKQFIESYFERQALNQALPSVQAQQQGQAITQGRSRGGRL